MPSFTSFTSPNQYTTETPATTSKLNCAYITGFTYQAPTFSGGNATNNPGNLFGWLIYSKAILSNPASGTTGDTYVYYTNPFDFISDLNLIGNCASSAGVLINSDGTANTFGFFINDNTTAVKFSNSGVGNEFLHVLDYLAYGGNIVIAGTTAGLYSFITNEDQEIDLIMGICGPAGYSAGFARSQNWLKNESPYTVGIFPTTQVGLGYTNGASLLADQAFVSGATVADRVFSVYGQKTRTNLSVPSLLANGTLTYTHALTPDVAGIFTRAKSRNEEFLSVAGSSRGYILNGDVSPAVNWSDSTLKNILKTSRVNYVLNFTTKFLGSDLVGCTASSSEPIVDERVGPAQLKTVVKRDVTNIAINYLYEINNETTRTLLVADIENYLTQYASFLDTTQTQITCDTTNNINNSSTLNIFMSLKPLAGNTNFVLNINLTQ
jgi:hypothetical protein